MPLKLYAPLILNARGIRLSAVVLIVLAAAHTIHRLLVLLILDAPGTPAGTIVITAPRPAEIIFADRERHLQAVQRIAAQLQLAAALM
jgi:hypothetical protein